MSKSNNNGWKKGHRSPSSSVDAILALQTAYSFFEGVHITIKDDGVLFTADLSWKYRTESFSETTLPLLAIKVNNILSKWQVQVFLDQSDALEEVAEAFRTVCETNSNLIDLYVGRNVSR